MSSWFIAKIKIRDPEEYQKYLDHAGSVFKKFRGEYLVLDNSPLVLEGTWDATRIVIIRFESEQDFKDWYYSREYQEILLHRLAASDCETILATGIS